MFRKLRRLQDRKVLWITSLLFAVRGFLLINGPSGAAPLAGATAYTLLPSVAWGAGFILVALLLLGSAFYFGYTKGRFALVVASGWALGFCTVPFLGALAGAVTLLASAVTWFYIAVMLSVAASQLDPHLLATIERERRAAAKTRNT